MNRLTRIPLVEGNADDTRLIERELRPATPAPPPTEALPVRRETILLVEDEDSVRRVVSRVLKSAGYHLLEARAGCEALAVLTAHAGDVDLLFTDVVLPEMGGCELAEQVRAHRPGIKVLFTSGYTDDVILEHRLLAHDAALLQKPFTLESLTRKVREALDG